MYQSILSNWQNSEKEYSFLPVEFPLINTERIMEIEKPPFGKYHGTMDTKITGQKYDEK